MFRITACVSAAFVVVLMLHFPSVCVYFCIYEIIEKSIPVFSNSNINTITKTLDTQVVLS